MPNEAKRCCNAQTNGGTRSPTPLHGVSGLGRPGVNSATPPGPVLDPLATSTTQNGHSGVLGSAFMQYCLLGSKTGWTSLPYTHRTTFGGSRVAGVHLQRPTTHTHNDTRGPTKQTVGCSHAHEVLCNCILDLPPEPGGWTRQVGVHHVRTVSKRRNTTLYKILKGSTRHLGHLMWVDPKTIWQNG